MINKELIFETSKGRFFIVENSPSVLRQIPHDLCERIGLLSALTEEQASEILDQSFHTGLFAHYVENIPVNTYCYKDWRDSLESLIKSKGWFTSNPIKIEAKDCNDDSEPVSMNDWQQAESRTLHNPVIFKIASDKV